MGTPFERNKYYFVKTITFYYVAKFERIRGGFATFSDVSLVKSVDDWSEFYRTKGRGEPHCNTIHINLATVVDITPW